MPLLAERKRKVKWTLNPGRQALWKSDDSNGIKFGKELMEKMGWKVGQGLGVNKQGIREPLRVAFQNDSKGMGFKCTGDEWIQQQQEFNEFLNKLSSSENAGKNAVEDRKNTIHSLEEKSRCSKARVHYKKFTRGKDLANYTEKDLECILGGMKEPIKQNNKNDDEDEFVNEDETELTVNAGSMVDYFARKMQNKAGVVGSDAVRKEVELTNSVVGECESSQEPVKKKKKSKGKELLTELPHKNHLEEKMDFLTCNVGEDNGKVNIFKEKSMKRSELDVNLIKNSQSDQTDSTALIKKPRDKVVVECEGSTSDFTGAECKSLRKGKRKHKTELDQNIKHSETELTVEKKKKRKKEKFSSSCGDETNYKSECSILEEGNGEESTGNEGAVGGVNEQCDVQKPKHKKKSRDERKNNGQYYDVGLQNYDHKSVMKESKNVKDSPAESEEYFVGNGCEETNRNEKSGNPKVDSNMYKTELLKTKGKMKDSNSNKIINLIQCTNIEKFNGSNLGLLKGYGIVRYGNGS